MVVIMSQQDVRAPDVDHAPGALQRISLTGDVYIHGNGFSHVRNVIFSSQTAHTGTASKPLVDYEKNQRSSVINSSCGYLTAVHCRMSSLNAVSRELAKSGIIVNRTAVSYNHASVTVEYCTCTRIRCYRIAIGAVNYKYRAGHMSLTGSANCG